MGPVTAPRTRESTDASGRGSEERSVDVLREGVSGSSAADTQP